jgi:hypothetical protein
MEVHCATAGRGEHLGRQDAAVSHDERDVGLFLAKPRCQLAGAHLGRLMYGKPQLERSLLHRGRRELQASATRPIRLANNCGNFGYLREGTQRRNRNLRSAEEHRAHASRAYSPACLKAKGIVPRATVITFLSLRLLRFLERQPFQSPSDR